MLENKKIIIILDNIRSVHNVGAIFRTADGVGVSEILICGITPTPDHKKLHKTALNAEEYVNWSYFKNTIDAINYCKSKKYNVYAIEQCKESVALNKAKLDENSAFLFGNEITGVAPAIITLCDNILEIPMQGKKNSLNVATCMGIVTYYFRLNE
jgi:23S rRNA (guanosine2251-2'-O)-methyltransferase